MDLEEIEMIPVKKDPSPIGADLRIEIETIHRERVGEAIVIEINPHVEIEIGGPISEVIGVLRGGDFREERIVPVLIKTGEAVEEIAFPILRN